jgi:hypothetical protein
MWDACPVSDGHALIIPRRHISALHDDPAENRNRKRSRSELKSQQNGFSSLEEYVVSAFAEPAGTSLTSPH